LEAIENRSPRGRKSRDHENERASQLQFSLVAACAPFVLISLDIVRMLWWFLILACSAGAVLWAGMAAYLRVRRHMKASRAAMTKSSVGREADNL
jgi:fatty acid desaturase